MTRKLAGLLAAAVLALLAAGYLWPSRTPTGQEPLLKLSGANFSEFEKAFDGQADGPRLVMLFSPT
jgi:hypothetical protein